MWSHNREQQYWSRIDSFWFLRIGKPNFLTYCKRGCLDIALTIFRFFLMVEAFRVGMCYDFTSCMSSRIECTKQFELVLSLNEFWIV
jgi:hypothetical protein